MRALALVPLFVLAACSETADGEPKEAKVAAAAMIDAGQWEVVSEVTQLTATDKGKPSIETPAGTKTSAASCVGEAARRRPAAELFAASGESCEYQNFYMSRGRLNASMKCDRPDFDGEMLRTVEGSFTADTLEGSATIETYSYGDGDVKIVSKLTGRRVGACAA